jgi:hypothetical protein
MGVHLLVKLEFNEEKLMGKNEKIKRELEISSKVVDRDRAYLLKLKKLMKSLIK